MKLHTKYQKPGLLVSDKKIQFQTRRFLMFGLCKKRPFLTKGQGQLKVIIFQTLLGPCLQGCIPSPRAIDPLVPEKKILKGFYHIGRGGHLGHVTQM